MTIIVRSNTTKRLYKATNICILLFTAIWLILFVLQLFEARIIEPLTVYLMLFSAPIFIIGVASAIIVAIIDETQEVSEDQIQQLLLNIDQKDYEKGNFHSIKPDKNFVVVQNFIHEINSVEALMLLEIAIDKGIEVNSTQQGNFSLDKNPKDLFNDCIGTLWASSI